VRFTNHNYDKIILDFDGVIVDSVKTKEEAFLSVLKDLYPDLMGHVQENSIALNGSRFQRAEKLNTEAQKNNMVFSSEDYLRSYSEVVSSQLLKAEWSKTFEEGLWNQSNVVIISLGFVDEICQLIEKKFGSNAFDLNRIYGSPTLKIDNTKKVVKENEKVLSIGDSLSDYKIAEELGLDFFYVKDWAMKNTADQMNSSTLKGTFSSLDSFYHA